MFRLSADKYDFHSKRCEYNLWEMGWFITVIGCKQMISLADLLRISADKYDSHSKRCEYNLWQMG